MVDRLVHPLITILVPALNEQASLQALYDRLTAVLSSTGCPYEIVLIDDGSTDGSAESWLAMRQHDQRLALVRLTRNFGKEAALLAGFRHAQGDVVIPIDADLQDPPEVIPEFIRRWREGYDIVYGVRQERDDPTWKRIAAQNYYRLLGSFSTLRIPADAGDFRLLDRTSVQRLISLPEADRYTKGLYTWIGGRQCAVPYHRPARQHGDAQQSLGKLLSLALDGLTGFTESPLRVLLWSGILVCLGAGLYGLAWLIVYLGGWSSSIPGYPSLLLFILFFGGLNLAALGVIGEYLARIYREVKRRPPYLIDTEITAISELSRHPASPPHSVHTPPG
jgi:glycosyltransferase involved in cell wall biosynthesis